MHWLWSLDVQELTANLLGNVDKHLTDIHQEFVNSLLSALCQRANDNLRSKELTGTKHLIAQEINVFLIEHPKDLDEVIDLALKIRVLVARVLIEVMHNLVNRRGEDKEFKICGSRHQSLQVVVIG
jgi:hypothetical protein